MIVMRSRRLTQRRARASGSAAGVRVRKGLTSSSAASEKSSGSSPGKSAPPSGSPEPIPPQSLLRHTAASQWEGHAEYFFTSSTLRLKP